MRPRWYTLKEICGIAFLVLMLAGAAAAACYELYRGWADHVVAMPWTRFDWDASLAHSPLAFWITIAFYVLGSVVSSSLLLLLIWWIFVAGRSRDRRAWETRPPLDNAIRQPADER